MTRTFSEPHPIQVKADPDGQPQAVIWRGRGERVRVCNAWLNEQYWWTGRLPRAYYKLLLARSRAILVVFHDESGWYVEQVLD